ncbi:septum formation inhibitor Maf [uncultured Muriicola sp.]|uniref:septum formation inhibitor Maf n=1 Tax=uncultured Muriicola sp. TaxID=1583102 RepID=UPI00260F9CCD|nr:septum formation inhibitor Maf [uncultured Muriicola sp.]
MIPRKTYNLTFSIFLLFIALTSCKKINPELAATLSTRIGHELSFENSELLPPKPLSSEFKGYWYAGDAEISSYALEQARYGELRKGTAVMIYVTEPFLPEKQVKAERNSSENISVLKLNATKNFVTGIYPYSIMSSTFFPVYDNQHALKISSSIQEWCGHVYTQLNNKNSFEVKSHSYFEKEGDQDLSIEKTHLENEFWTRIRLHPEDLPVGTLKVIPSLEYLRLAHQPIKAYKAEASLQNDKEIITYIVSYPDLKRTLKINFSASFPYGIESWTDSYPSGFGPDSEILTTKAIKIKTLNTPYWRLNGNENVSLRDTLGI